VEVGVREFKTHLSSFLDRVKAGEVLIITDRGKPVAKLEPIGIRAPSPYIESLIRAGKVRWSGRAAGVPQGVSMTPGDSIADRIMAERERD
jgi:prevent-host-death family protein